MSVFSICLLVSATLPDTVLATTSIDKPQEWVTKYRRIGGIAEFNEKHHRLDIGILKEASDQVSLASFLRAKGVARVALYGDGIRDIDVRAVLKWPGVTHLYMLDCVGVSDDIFVAIRHAKLKEITLWNISVTAKGMSSLSGSDTLEDINVSTSLNENFSDLRLIKMKKLRLLSLCMFGITSVSLSDMPALEEVFPTFNNDPTRLEKAVFTNLPRLTNVDFSLAPLKSLTISGCPALSEFRARKSVLSDSDLKLLLKDNHSLNLVRGRR